MNETATDLWIVEVINDETEEVVNQSKPTYRRRAEKIEDGYSINLNHAAYSTRIVAAPTNTALELGLATPPPVSAADGTTSE